MNPLYLAASFVTILQIWLYGDRTAWGPIAGLASTVLWVAVMYQLAAWEFAPLNVVTLAVHFRNLRKMKMEAAK